MYIFGFSICFLFKNLNPQLSLIIWDVLFLEGNLVLFKAALGLFKIFKKEIMQKDSVEEINLVIEEGLQKLIDVPTFVYYLILRKFEINQEFIERNRHFFEQNILETVFANRYENTKREKERLLDNVQNKQINRKDLKRNSYFNATVECNIEWPLCIYDTYYKYDIINCFVLTLHGINFIDDYYFKKCYSEADGSNKVTTIHIIATKSVQLHKIKNMFLL